MSQSEEIKSYLVEEQWGTARNSFTNPEIQNFSDDDKFSVLSWWAACPRRDKVLTAYQNAAIADMSKKPVQWIFNRYDTTNYVTWSMWQHAKEVNPTLHTELTRSIARPSLYPVGDFEPENVPSSHTGFMSGMSRLSGYAPSRIQILRLSQDILNETTHPYITMRDLQEMEVIDFKLDSLIRSVKTSIEFLVRLGELAEKENISSSNIVEHLWEKEKALEENDIPLRLAVFEELLDIDPNLWVYANNA